jgi:phosphoribosylanthranilate isomerase
MKIKLCGLFREEDIEAANEAGPDYIGFVFAEKSRRRVSMEQAAHLHKGLREGIAVVGVFLHEKQENIVALYRDAVIDLAQLHGDESPQYIAALRQDCTVPVIKSVRVETGSEIEAVSQCGAHYFLLDHGAGGSGERFDWQVLSEHTASLERPWFLAGGITVDTIVEAMRYKPYGIDVSSGAETRGLKDREKMIRLVELVRSAS